MNRQNINNRFKDLIAKLKSDDFYEDRGLGNEVPFYIFDYPPEKELDIRDKIKNELFPEIAESKLQGVEIDLFDLLLESLERDKIFEKVFEMEEKRGTEVLYQKLKNSFNMDTIIKYIKEKSEGKNFIVLTGVGKIFPLVRTHAILNNLQTVFNDTKVLLFFPGEYTEIDLKIFGFKDNNYYRAFRL